MSTATANLGRLYAITRLASLGALRGSPMLTWRNVSRPGQALKLLEHGYGAHPPGDAMQLIVTGAAPNTPMSWRSRPPNQDGSPGVFTPWRPANHGEGFSPDAVTDASGAWALPPGEHFPLEYEWALASFTWGYQFQIGDEVTNEVTVPMYFAEGAGLPAGWDANGPTPVPPPATPPPVMPPTAMSAATVKLFNLTRPGDGSFIVGDQFRVEVTGAPSQPVTSTATQNGSSSTGVMGQTDGAGKWSTEGTMGTTHIGTWSEVWQVGLKQATPILSFTVAAASSPKPDSKPETDTKSPDKPADKDTTMLLGKPWFDALPDPVKQFITSVGADKWPSWVWLAIAGGALWLFTSSGGNRK